MRTIILLLLFPFIVSCQEKFNGTNEDTFKESKEKLELTLDETEKIKLEKALLIVVSESITLKWEEPEKYKGLSFDEISMKLVDGLSYSSTIEFAEKILKKRNNEEIRKTEEEIEKLNLETKSFKDIEQQLNLFRISYFSINKDDFFDEKVLKIKIECEYVSNKETKGEVSIEYALKQKSTNKIISMITYLYGTEETTINKGDTKESTLIVSNSPELNPKLWNATNFPLSNPNLATFDLALEAKITKIVSTDGTIELPSLEINEIYSKIEVLNQKLKEIQALKGTLDELELE